MKIEIEILDGSDELLELQTIVAQINIEQGAEAPPMTASQYVNNIVQGYFANRVLNNYKAIVLDQSKEELKAMAKNIKAKKKVG